MADVERMFVFETDEFSPPVLLRPHDEIVVILCKASSPDGRNLLLWKPRPPGPWEWRFFVGRAELITMEGNRR